MTSKTPDGGQAGAGNGTAEEVGYGRPPVAHRFQKGTSGNPRGRPRKPRQLTAPVLLSIDDLVRAEASRPLSFRENGIEVSLPAIQVGLRSAAHAAAKGNHRAQLMMTNLLGAAERRKREEQAETLRVYVEFKQRWEDAFARCDKRGASRPEPVPHPDDVVLDLSTGELVINGPSNPGQKEAYDFVTRHREQFVEGIDWMQKQKRRRKIWSVKSEALLDGMQRAVVLIDHVLPSLELRRSAGFNIREWRRQQPPYEEEMSKYFGSRWDRPR